MARRYWLMKSDPETFGWEELVRSPKRTTRWDGIRNYQARNLLRDEVKKGDGVLFYHSQADKAVVGTAVVARSAYPDPTQFERKHPAFDPKSDPKDPTWYAVDLAADRRFERPVTLDAMRSISGLEDMFLLRKGMRLSVQPVTPEEWTILTKLGAKA